MYSRTTKDKQIRVNKGYREEQDNTISRSQQKEREKYKYQWRYFISSTREEIENLKKNLKYIKKTLIAMTSQQRLANRVEANDN